jgi:F-type H+-transporting ATPase subunit b
VELNWSTFLLEILNFLVLVWILKRFLYRPVQELVARRREKIEQQMHSALQTRESAEALQRQYETRLADWERERQGARDGLQRELDAQRTQRLRLLDAELAERREKAQVLDARERQAARQDLEVRALELGAAFAARLLQRAAGAELEQRLVSLALEDLAAMPPGERQTLAEALQDTESEAEALSAYPLSQDLRQALSAALTELAGRPVGCRFGEDPELIAGLRLRLDSRVLHANLRDELKAFAESGHANAP